MLGRAAHISKSALYLYLGGLQKLGFLPISLLTPPLSLQGQPPSFEVLFAPSWVSQEGKPAAAAPTPRTKPGLVLIQGTVWRCGEDLFKWL